MLKEGVSRNTSEGKYVSDQMMDSRYLIGYLELSSSANTVTRGSFTLLKSLRHYK